MSAIRGWCPGVLRPMPSGDGLIVRLRITGGILQPDQARQIALLAREHGNGLLDLSSRGNLQLRGIRPETLEPLQAGLAELGLIDPDAAAEAVRNVTSSPLAGIDSTALVKISDLVMGLERRLTGDLTLHDLPGKFCFSIDDGGRHSLRDVNADVSFEAQAGNTPSFGIALATQPAAYCSPEQLVDVASRLAKSFLALRTDETRMRDLIARLGIETVLQHAELDFQTLTENQRSSDVLGYADGALGVGVTFGRLNADSLELLADLAPRDLRLSPFRAIFLTGVDPAELPAMRNVLQQAGFVLDEADPIRRVAACPGAPACANATTDVRRDAMVLAPLMTGNGIALHVSGCAKGCAHPGVAPMTLVGRNGRYDLILNGTADSVPQAEALDCAQIAALNALEFA